jgi:hypothetical protein
MITYKKFIETNMIQKIVDGTPSGEWHDPELSQAYLAWLAEGNEPLPADAPAQPE